MFCGLSLGNLWSPPGAPLALYSSFPRCWSTGVQGGMGEGALTPLIEWQSQGGLSRCRPRTGRCLIQRVWLMERSRLYGVARKAVILWSRFAVTRGQRCLTRGCWNILPSVSFIREGHLKKENIIMQYCPIAEKHFVHSESRVLFKLFRANCRIHRFVSLWRQEPGVSLIGISSLPCSWGGRCVCVCVSVHWVCSLFLSCQ